MKFSIKELRRARDISQEEMANLCEVHLNTYRAWEDNPADIRLSKAVIIADKLGIELKDVLFLPQNTNEIVKKKRGLYERTCISEKR